MEDHKKTIDDLLEEYSYIAKKAVTKIKNRIPAHIEYDVLYSEALVNLWNAIKQYRPEKNSSIKPYLIWRIRWGLIDYLRRIQFYSRKEKRMAIHMISFDAPFGEDDAPLLNTFVAPENGLDSFIDDTDQLQFIMNQLPGHYQQLLKLRYIDEYTYKEIGYMMGVCKSRAMQITQSVVNHARKIGETRGSHQGIQTFKINKMRMKILQELKDVRT
jgi:RNA polymerase sigma factor (sigma-70 family)